MSWAFRGPSRPKKPFIPFRAEYPPPYPLEPSPGLKDDRLKLSDWAMRTFAYYAVFVYHWKLDRSSFADFYGISPRGYEWLIEVKCTKHGEYENPTLTFALYDSKNVIEFLDKTPSYKYALVVYFNQPYRGVWRVALNSSSLLAEKIGKLEPSKKGDKRSISLRWFRFKDLHRVVDLHSFLAYY
jgi:hypothetical protein